MATRTPLIVIVGPTASGKTTLAIEVAKKYEGEIICADSRTVFREMNIGTAKPTLDERDGIPHWGLNLTAPGERYTAAAFKQYTNNAIIDIRSRGKVPIIAGGTGLYVDGIIFDYEFPREVVASERSRLEAMSVDKLHQYCVENNLELPINDKNKRHLVRVALQGDVPQRRRESLLNNTYIFGLAIRKQELRHRIEIRAEHMFEDGVVNEAKLLGNKYGWESEAMTGNIYPLVRQYIDQQASLEETIHAFVARDWQLAKRQMTWFRRNPFIVWGDRGDISARIDQLFTAE